MAVVVTDSTVDDADAYFSTRLNSVVWTGSGEADKVASLTTAANILNSMEWMGRPVSSLAAFPRYLEGYRGPVIPQRILWALYELAIHLLANPSLLIQEESVESLVIGPVQLQTLQPVELLPKIVKVYIGPYTQSSGAYGGGPIWWRAN